MSWQVLVMYRMHIGVTLLLFQIWVLARFIIQEHELKNFVSNVALSCPNSSFLHFRQFCELKDSLPGDL